MAVKLDQRWQAVCDFCGKQSLCIGDQDELNLHLNYEGWVETLQETLVCCPTCWSLYQQIRPHSWRQCGYTLVPKGGLSRGDDAGHK
jgi:hypothetical protein